MLDARLRRGCCQPRRCQPVYAIVCGGVGALGVGNAGEMNDLIDAVQQRLPVERFRQIRMLHHFDAIGERQMRPPHCRAHGVAVLRQGRDNGIADEAGGAGDQDAAHERPRSNTVSSQVTRTAPKVSAAISLGRPGTITETTARMPRPIFTANTRATTAMVEKPLSVAR